MPDAIARRPNYPIRANYQITQFPYYPIEVRPCPS